MASTVVAGLFDSPSQAQSAVEQLVNAGIRRDDISLISRDERTADRPAKRESLEEGTGLATSTAAGALFGSLGGLLLGLGALAIPGVGPIVAAGPIAATLAGAGIGAAGGLMIAALRESGIPEEDAHLYAESIRRGCTLVTVRNVDGTGADKTSDIMDSAGAVDVEERASVYRKEGWKRFDEQAGPYEGPRDFAQSTRQSELRRRVRTYPSAIGQSPGVSILGTGRTDKPSRR